MADTPANSRLPSSSAVAKGPRAITFLLWFSALVAGSCATIMTALVLLDPYGAGRLLPKALDRPLALAANPNFASAARFRKPMFNAFVVGNSTLQTLDPDRLNALTGLSFGQATAPGTGPLEQEAMLSYVGRVRSGSVKAVVLGIDFTWCDPALMRKGRNPFPLWLYDPSPFGYLAGLFRMNSLEALPKRIAVLAGLDKPPRADGYWNYELHVQPRPYPFGTPQVATPDAAERSAAAALRRALNALSPQTRVAIVLAPIYRGPDDSRSFDNATGAATCRAELTAAAAERPNTAVIDFWRDTDFNRKRMNFLDSIHFLEPVARIVEQAAAEVLK